MGIAVRFLSGSYEGREFVVEKDILRIGDAEDVDIRVDPSLPENAGARDRVIEVFRDGNLFRIHSIGSREISAQGEMAIDRKVEPGEDVRFGAWGPVFTLASSAGALSSTAPVRPVAAQRPAPTPPPQSRAPVDVRDIRTESGEKPVGPKTVYMMIQDALGKAKGVEGSALERGTVFVREMVSDTIRSATRSLKIGLAFMAAALLILGGVLVYNIVSTRESIKAASQAADHRVESVKTELSVELAGLKAERDHLNQEAQALSKRIADLEKGTSGDQKSVAALRAQLQDAEEKRLKLEARMTQAMSSVEADRAALAAEKSRLEAQRATEEKAAKERAEREAASRPAEPASAQPAAAPTPQAP